MRELREHLAILFADRWQVAGNFLALGLFLAGCACWAAAGGGA